MSDSAKRLDQALTARLGGKDAFVAMRRACAELLVEAHIERAPTKLSSLVQHLGANISYDSGAFQDLGQSQDRGLRVRRPAGRRNGKFDGRQLRGLGDRRLDQPRNGAPDTARDGICGDKLQYWVIPPNQDAEFVARMEALLETYAQPHTADRPVGCMDEQPVQLVRETRATLSVRSAAARQRARVQGQGSGGRGCENAGLGHKG